MGITRQRPERKLTTWLIVVVLVCAAVVGVAAGLLIYQLVKDEPAKEASTNQGRKPPSSAGGIPAPAYTTENVTLMKGTEFETSASILTSSSASRTPVVFVMGGVHGNEESGYIAADKLAGAKVSAGTLIVLPRANQVAIRNGRREGTVDLNRQFPGNVGGTGETRLAGEIVELLRSRGASLDLNYHSSPGSHNVDSAMYGQTVIFDFEETSALPYEVVATVNQGISNPLEKYSVLIEPIETSATYALYQTLRIPAYGIEVSSPLGLDKCTYYHLKVTQAFCDRVGLKVDNWPELLGQPPS